MQLEYSRTLEWKCLHYTIGACEHQAHKYPADDLLIIAIAGLLASELLRQEGSQQRSREGIGMLPAVC